MATPLRKDIALAYDAGRKQVDEKSVWDARLPDPWASMTTPFSQKYTDEPVSFELPGRLPLPDALLEQFSHLECKCFMGLFPEIQRAWITIDNRLFLWNFGGSGGDFTTYDGVDQVIISVGLVVPRPDVFLDEIKYLLVLATPVEVIILGISFVGDEITIVPTQMSVPSDNVNMLKIVGTAKGRIFMCGRDGCLYELVYQADDGWFSSKVRKLNHSQGRMTQFLIPSFLKFSAGDPILDVVVDDARNILYTLSEKSHIQVFDLGADGLSITHVTTNNDIARMVTEIHPRGNWTDQTLRIVTIAPLAPSESSVAHLVGITSEGMRLYFTTFPLRRGTTRRVPTRLPSNARVPPKVLDLLHVRLEPMLQARGVATQVWTVHTGFYQHSVVLAAMDKGDSDVLLCITPDQTTTSRSSTSFTEIVQQIEVPAKVWAIAEVTPTLLGGNAPPEALFNVSELAVQHRYDPRHFVVLSGAGAYIVERTRPIKSLEDLLRQSRGTRTEDLARFFQRFGRVEGCAMCLVLATRWSAPRFDFDGTSIPSDENMVRWARSTFLAFGGEAQFMQPEALEAGYSTVDMGRAVTLPDVTYSFMHDALVLFLSRILRPVWTSYITFSKEGGKYQRCRFTQELLQELRMEFLLPLKEFMEQTHQLFAGPDHTSGSSPLHRNVQKRLLRDLAPQSKRSEAIKMEQRSLYNVYQILTRSMEALSLLSILSECNFARLVARMTHERLTALSHLTFRDLVLAGDPQASVTSDLIAHLMADQSQNVDSLSERLRSNCPSYFSDMDMIQCKAMELLQAAKKQTDPTERSRLISESLKLFMRAVEVIPLPTICQEFSTVHCYTGSVELALARAKCVETDLLAQQGRTAYTPADEDDLVTQAQFAKEQAYDCVLATLENLFVRFDPSLPQEELDRHRSRVLQVALASQDPMFHNILYPWFTEDIACSADSMNRTEFLLNLVGNLKGRLHATHFERFLRDRKRYDILWKYFVRIDKYEAAADILVRLAEDRDPHIQLSDRLQFLSLAILNIKSIVGEPLLRHGQLERELQEKMEVAEIQAKISEELKRAPLYEDDMEARSIRDEARRELDEQLFDISALYNRFACKFQLWESQLAILWSSGYDDQAAVRKCWAGIIQTILEPQDLPDGLSSSLGALRSKVLSLGRQCYPSYRFAFPVNFIVSTLENYRFTRPQYDDGVCWTVNLLQEIGLPLDAIYGSYRELFMSRGDPWHLPETRLHLLEVIKYILEYSQETHTTDPRVHLTAQTVMSDARQFLAELGRFQFPNAPDAVRRVGTLQNALRHVISTW